MLQRVVWNRLELNASLVGGCLFTGPDDGILRGVEQAQRLPNSAKHRLFHFERDLLLFSDYEICRYKFVKNLSKLDVWG